MFTHYAFNTQAINPAYCGSRDAMTVTALHRSQWVSFPGAPVTQTLSINTPILNYKIGLGLSILNDKIGPSNITSVYFDFSYRIKLGPKAKLAFGLKGGLNVNNINLTALNTKEDFDPLFLEDLNSKLLPNFGFGLYLSTENYYLGLSIPKLMENNFLENTVSGSVNLASEEKHYFFIAGAVLKLSEDIKLKPTTFIKVTNAAPIEGDITTSVIFKDRLWIGAMYRTGDAFGALAGLNITDKLSVGYSFDWSTTNKTSRYNHGSHEIMIRYDYRFRETKMIRSPRYF
jgi:type IX secretion system PorP/SprF family membrane protein